MQFVVSHKLQQHLNHQGKRQHRGGGYLASVPTQLHLALIDIDVGNRHESVPGAFDGAEELLVIRDPCRNRYVGTFEHQIHVRANHTDPVQQRLLNTLSAGTARHSFDNKFAYFKADFETGPTHSLHDVIKICRFIVDNNRRPFQRETDDCIKHPMRTAQ